MASYVVPLPSAHRSTGKSQHDLKTGEAMPCSSTGKYTHVVLDNGNLRVTYVGMDPQLRCCGMYHICGV